MPQLEQIDSFTSQIFWLFAFFGLIYFFILKIVSPKISGIVDGRENLINSDILTASKAKDEAKNFFEIIDKKISKSRLEAFEMVSKATSEANNLYSNELSKAEQDLLKNLEISEKEIIKAKELALEELQKESAIFVEDILVKFAGLKIEKQLIEKALSVKN